MPMKQFSLGRLIIATVTISILLFLSFTAKPIKTLADGPGKVYLLHRSFGWPFPAVEELWFAKNEKFFGYTYFSEGDFHQWHPPEGARAVVAYRAGNLSLNILIAISILLIILFAPIALRRPKE